MIETALQKRQNRQNRHEGYPPLHSTHTEIQYRLSGCLQNQPRGVENSGGWKTYRKFGEKPSPKTFLDPPPTIRFPPPLFWRLSVISLKRKRHRPDQPQFLRPPKVVLESTLCSTFSPPQIHAIRFAPPPQPLPVLYTPHS